MDQVDAGVKDKLRPHRILPEDIKFEQLTYHDKKFIEEYFCNRTNMYYFQRNRYDAIGMLPFADDKIRIYYKIPINDKKYEAEFKNSLGRLEPLSDGA